MATDGLAASPVRQVQSMPHQRLDRDPSRYVWSARERRQLQGGVPDERCTDAYPGGDGRTSLTTFPIPGFMASTFQVELVGGGDRGSHKALNGTLTRVLLGGRHENRLAKAADSQSV